ncbi:MAG: YfiR family protein [candidate division Zixibacteria bacterium]|nr:YfiR family protein [candidate division Zixibacteria bacterium]MBU1470227.1 YfiR family protein [candidate division Zixibacteria bacterium]MBU2626758.1 YfiR family protein [candidate division Zixibacteria bacterium]
MSRPFSVILLVLVCTAAIGVPTTVHADKPTEYQLKVAYLYNFIKFVEWPTNVLSEDDTLLQICVLGENPFGPALDEMVSGKEISGRQISIVYAKTLAKLDSSHVVFVARSETDNLDKILEQLEGVSILTISDIDGFVQRGGIIGFLTEDNKIRFIINVDVAEKAGLQISSQLLRMSRSVDQER